MSKEDQKDYIEMYQNRVQVLANIVDPNKLFAVAGRGLGKTSQITAPRILRVAQEMPRELSIISHKSFVALFTNVIPTVLESFRTEITMPDGTVRPKLIEGVDYVVGEKDLPRHFHLPRYPLLDPERCITFASGHVLQAVAIDRADSIAGRSVVHAFLEEMKYSNGEKVRTRIIPAIRTSRIGMGSDAHKSHLHGGITGVTDIGRVSLGEFNWYLDYEKETNPQLIADIVTLALEINNAQYNLYLGKNPSFYQAKIAKWTPVLTKLRKKAILFLRASTFANRDVLGVEYFRTQRDILDMSEFLSSICSIGDRNRDNLFFDLFEESKHTYDDSYRYSVIDKLNLKDSFTLTAEHLKYYNPTQKILLGYDPGSFSSVVAAQEDKSANALRIQKEFYVYPPEDAADLAAKINAYYSPAAKLKQIDLYYDRAGNKRNREYEKDAETDAKKLKKELENYGWRVRLMNLGQATIYHWQHYRLWRRLLAETERSVPRIRIDANECQNLVSAIYCCKKIPGSTPVELDKSPERKVRIDMQAGLTPQIPSAMTYLVWGLYEKYFPGVKSSSSAGNSFQNFTG
jgi:hypothetical protein